MAEAEDVIADVARHATIYARALWLRHRRADRRAAPLALAAIAPRLDLLIVALVGRSLPLRIAQKPAPATFLSRIFRRAGSPMNPMALPATDGVSLWLPPQLGTSDALAAAAQYRAMALQQAMRALRGSAACLPDARDPLVRDLYLLLETVAADHDLVRMLPGMAAPLHALRRMAQAARPALSAFPAHLRALEQLAREALAAGLDRPWQNAHGASMPCATPAQSLLLAQRGAVWLRSESRLKEWGRHPLWKDAWTGDLQPPPEPAAAAVLIAAAEDAATDPPPRSARLSRRPQARAAADEEDEHQGAWMVQTAQPHEQAEDPAGLQRPTDRDDTTAAEQFADALSELPEARLVATPGQPKEVLLSDDPPDPGAKREVAPRTTAETALVYPEWDYRIAAYHAHGATVRILPAVAGPQAWVEHTLADHRGMLHEIRRRFEMLRAQRQRVRKQLDGDEVDLAAYIDGYADFRAGLPLPPGIYQNHRRARRDMAVMLLIDVSGSTDGWIVGNRRIIDVEREALLLVCIALDGLAQPYAVQAFSGESAQSVVLREIKRFDERFDNRVARRIAGLEPEHYTRAGAALRHATTQLLGEPAQHRLLLLLSDGKPNDVDHYEGRYGVEDLRQAVIEAKLQGIAPFCLTIDRQAANYLPFVFGPSQYALLPKPELLPTVLLDWLRRLIGS